MGNFDKTFYLLAYPDIAQAGVNPETHYNEFGQKEGRKPRLEIFEWGSREIIGERDTILIVSHECSNTGCPILSKNLARELSKKFNVFFITFGNGPILKDLPEVSSYGFSIPIEFRLNKKVIQYALERNLTGSQVRFAIVNSVMSSCVLGPLSHIGIPTVCCIHEYSWLCEKSLFDEVSHWATNVVFPTEATLQAAQLVSGNSFREAQIIPQGFDGFDNDIKTLSDSEIAFQKTLQNYRRSGYKIISGIGYSDYRKGEDLFWIAAKRIKELLPNQRVKFIWAGNYTVADVFGQITHSYISRLGLTQDVILPGFLDKPQSLYENSDLLLLTSRMDPLPSTILEASISNVPFVCFDGASGYVDFLDSIGLRQFCIAREADPYDMGSMAVKILENEALKKSLGETLNEKCHLHFNMASYVKKLQECGEIARQKLLLTSSAGRNVENPLPEKKCLQRRLAFFTFYEKEGIARRYIIRYLKGLQEVAERIILVANGNLSESSRREIETLGVEVLQRENFGLDFAAWNYAIQQLGLEEIRGYDELILCNCSCYGPIYSFSETFERMDKEQPEIDFWGMTNHLENKNAYIIPEDKKSYIREHIQSYFLVLKKPVLQSDVFRNYWRNFKLCSTFAEEVYEHETKFTEFLSENGFQWSVAYPATSNEWDSTYYNCLENVQNRCPLVKRKLFSCAPLDWEAFTEGDTLSRLLRYLDSIGYPVGEIYEDLLATQLLSRINRNLHLTYCVCDEVMLPKNQDKPKVALIFFSYYEDHVGRYLSYLKNFPDFVDIFVVLRPSQKTGQYQELFARLPNRIEYRIKKENRGRDFAAYMIECRDVFDHYDIVCCTKDKKSPQNGIYVAKSFDEHCWKNVAYSRGYINGVINLFLRNERLGLVMPPVLDFGPFCTLGSECRHNEKAFKNLWTELNLRVPYEDGEIAPFGSMFWVRSKATQTIRSKIWTYADIPKEPLAVDGSLLHALERMWAYGAQNDGFYTLTCFPLALANAYYGLSTQHLKELRRKIFNRFGVRAHRDLVLHFDQIVRPLPPQLQARKETTAQVDFGFLFKAIRYYLRGHYAWTHLRRVYYREKLKKLFDVL